MMFNGALSAMPAKLRSDDERNTVIRPLLYSSEQDIAAYAAGLNPRSMTDEALDAATADYRLLHIRRTEARTGPGGPGDLAWLWPLSTLILMWLLFRRCRRCCKRCR